MTTRTSRPARTASTASRCPGRSCSKPSLRCASSRELRGVGGAFVLRRGAVPRDIDGAALADHGHLDLARVLELGLDLARDLVREQDGAVVVDLLRLHDHADLAPRLERVDLV